MIPHGRSSAMYDFVGSLCIDLESHWSLSLHLCTRVFFAILCSVMICIGSVLDSIYEGTPKTCGKYQGLIMA